MSIVFIDCFTAAAVLFFMCTSLLFPSFFKKGICFISHHHQCQGNSQKASGNTKAKLDGALSNLP